MKAYFEIGEHVKTNSLTDVSIDDAEVIKSSKDGTIVFIKALTGELKGLTIPFGILKVDKI